MTAIDWQRQLRFIFDTLDDISDPIERLSAVQEARDEITDLLTTVTERACWDARRTDRTEEALPYVSERALLDYSRRWNGRLRGAERVRWNDPLNPHRRQQVLDLTEVAEFKTPESVRTARRQRRPHRVQNR